MNLELAPAEPRPTEDEYPHWLSKTLNVKLEKEDQNYYENTASSLVGQFADSGFWRAVVSQLRNRDQTHILETTYPLLAHSNMATPSVVSKPFDSLVLKTYRKNILGNTNWPEAPDGGWITPDNWLTAVSDIVRTAVVVKYLDGVEIVCELVNQVADSLGIPRSVEYEARDDGYYAAHSTIRVPLRYNTKAWVASTLDISVEIQVTTQVQDVIKALTHKFYEERRRRVCDETKKWQWSYRSEEFTPNYLGHILHYVEGMIMEIRDKQEGRHG